MIDIEIKPAYGMDDGYLTAKGHASPGREAVCEAVTVIENCLAANLEDTWDIKADGTTEKGYTRIWWHKTDRKGRGVERANQAAYFAYTGLKALAMAYPENVTVKWRRPAKPEDRWRQKEER